MTIKSLNSILYSRILTVYEQAAKNEKNVNWCQSEFKFEIFVSLIKAIQVLIDDSAFEKPYTVSNSPMALTTL